MRNLLIDRPGGGHVRLGQVADVRVAPTPAVIERDAVSRRVDVEADVSGRSLGAVAERRRGAPRRTLSFPLEYHAEVLKDDDGRGDRLDAHARRSRSPPRSRFLLLQAAFRSWRLAALAFLTLPVALVGGVLAALIAGADLSLGALPGFLAAVRHRRAQRACC